MVNNIIQKAKKAKEIFANYAQKEVDKIFYYAAKAANQNRIKLAQMAFKETQMGIVEDKIIKNNFACEYIYNIYKNLQTCGVIEHDEAGGYEKIYVPKGIICAIIPTTNPTSTTIFKCLIALKTRNVIVLSPHPRAYKSTIETAKIILDAAIKAGAPKDVILWLPQNSNLDDTKELMKLSDLILATGGSSMVHAAYSSGTPAIGVGPGNCPAIIDSTADIEMSVASIIQSNMFDNGMICATENSVICVADVYDKVINEFSKQQAYVVEKKTDINKISLSMFKDKKNYLLNPNIVGKCPHDLANVFGINIPDYAKIIVVPTNSTSITNPLAHEKLSTFISIYRATNFDDALRIQNDLLKLGAGHTSSLFCNELISKEHIDKFKSSSNTGRLIVNCPSSLAAIGDFYNFRLLPSLTLGCGSVGRNSVSDNIGPKHLLDIKQVAIRRENMMWIRIPSKVYFNYGCCQEGLKDLYDDGIKKVFIVTDKIIWNFFGERITKILDTFKIKYKIFDDVEPNPTLATTKRGFRIIHDYEPEAIIAFGGGSVLDAAKLMWFYNENPNVDFNDLALRFIDIRKRIVKFNTPKKVKLVCIPTTAGTGSEVTPFAIITDEKTHIKYSLADYALIPTIAIIDSQFMMSLPKRSTAITAADALSHCFESYVSVLANEFTRPYSMQGIKIIFKYLKRAYEYGQNDKEAKTAIAHAATIAGIAFGNAYLGVVHSLSHKIGGYFGVMHGAANAIYLPYVIRYNSAKFENEKQMYWPKFKHNDVRQKYCEIADELKIPGKSETQKINNLIKEIQKLFKSVNLWKSTKEYGIDNDKFYKIIDEMSVEAFDDQCTLANPRLPKIKELKQLFIDAHEGNKIQNLKE